MKISEAFVTAVFALAVASLFLVTLRDRARKLVLVVILAAMAATSGPVSAAPFFWDPDASTTGNDADGTGLGGSGTWDTSTVNWWDLTSLAAWPNTISDSAIFSYAFPALGIPTTNAVTLSSGITANLLQFNRTGYTLSGGAITLAGTAAGLYAQFGESATISNNLLGSAGLIKSGGGSIRLTGDNSGLTGALSIAGGSLIINGALALPGSGAVSVTSGNGTPSNVNLGGFTGGSLVLDGTAAGFTFSRDVNLEGHGPIGGRGSAIQSLGNNTLSGIVSTAVSPLTPATIRNSRINSVNGTLTLSGTLNAGGTSTATITNLGGINSAGVGNFDLTGVLSGTGTIRKSGSGTLFLTPSSTSGFSGTVRVAGVATVSQSSVRVTQLSVGGTSIFGANVGTNASSAIDMTGGVLEFRNDGNLDFNSLSSGKNVYLRATSTFYTGPAAGGSGVNGLTSLGTFRVASNTIGTFNSRNGFGMTLGAWTQESSTNPNTMTNNMGGTLTFTGNAWGNTDTTARALTIGGDGNTTIVGSLIASGALHSLTKSGTGNLTIQGVASTLTGAVNITAGAVTVTDFRSLNNNTAAISLGNATTGVGNLIIGGVGAPTVAGLTTSKTITLNGTTASNSIYANQTGANPVILNGAITKIAAATTGALVLGGTNTADNIVNVVVPVEATPSTGGVTKVGPGTWVLNAANTYLGATTIQNGTLKLRATAGASDVVKGGSVTFSADATTQSAGGTLQFRGFLNTVTTETLGALTPTTGAAKIETLANGAATTLTFASLGARGAGAYVDYQPGASSTIAFTTLPTVTDGILGEESVSAFQTFNGVDWATLSGSNVAQFTGYTVGMPASGARANREYSQAVNITTTAAQSINTLKLIGGGGNPTVTLGGLLTLAGRAILFDNSSGVGTITGSQLGAAATEVHIITNGSNPANGGVSGVALTLGNALTINSLIGSTTGSFTKSGTGTLIVGGNNTFTGNVIINEGIVQLSGATATLGVNSTAANLTAVRQGATLDINAAGASRTINVGALVGAGVITNSGGGSSTTGTISFGRSTSTGLTIFSGVLQDGAGVLNVTVDGTIARTQAFMGQSTYTGVTTIATGAQLTVDVLANGTFASGIGSSTNVAGNLVFNGTAPQLVYRGNTRVGSLNLGSASATTDRLFTISGAGAILSSTVSNDNAIVFSNTGAIVHGTNAARTLTLTGTSTGDNTFNPLLSNSTGFVTSFAKTGAGQWNLGNSGNTYTGLTTINEGILGLNANGAIHANSPIVLTPTSATSAAILQMSGTFDRTLTATPTAGAGGVNFGFSIASTTGGVGFAAHSTPLSVAIGGIATPTALTWGSGGFVGTGGVQNLVLNSTTALSSVDFRNAIALGALARTINVLDNINTGADYATMSGVLSGTGAGLIKTGAGILRLTGANTYTGVTDLNEGTLVVSSLGRSTGAPNTPTSVGVSGVTFNDTNAVTLGNGGTGSGILSYVGAGETSDRKVRFNTTITGGPEIHADGAGPLILTNVANDMASGLKTLFLRGSSMAGNMITSRLSDNGGALSVTIGGNATWILTNSTNNYTGPTSAGAGALGIGHNTALGAGPLTIFNGNVFAYGADRTIANTLNLGNNAISGFLGDYNLTFTGTNNLAADANNLNLYNSVVAGKAVTFNGLLANALTATRAWAIDGPGETIINGNFTTSTAFGVQITKSGDGTLTLGGDGTVSNWNQVGTGIDVDRGTLKFITDNAINSSTSAFAGITLTPEVATTDTATVDLNGTTQTVNSLTGTSNGVLIIDNTSASAATFRFGANNSTVNFGSGVGTYTVQNTGAGALSLVKLGNTSTTFITGITLAHKGTTASEGGGVFTIASPVTATTGLRAIGASTLALAGGLPNGNLVTSVEVGGGSTLTLLDGAGSQMSNLTTLRLGNTGTGTVILNLNVGDLNNATDRLNTDSFTLLTGGTLNLGNTVTFNMTDAGLNALQTYTLLNLADGGLTAFGIGNLIQGATPGGFDSFTWNVTNNLVQLTTGNLLLNDLYWRGSTNNTWNGNVNNWSTDKAGTLAATSIPGLRNKVIFAWDNPGSGALTTTLEQNFKINSLVFEAGGTTTPSSVTINPGALATARLEIAPTSSANGIGISAGGPAAVTIGANLRLGADQTWNVAGSASTLTLGGALFGEADVTKSGAGRVVLSGAADPTFNAGQTATFTVTGGNLELTNSAALGTLANSNLAGIVVNGGGFYYNNAVAGTALTLPHAITLGGGALSGGGANHFYGGTVNVSANSIVNMSDSNAALTGTARNITLSGVISGGGNLTINSSNAPSSGNQLSGTLLMNNVSNSWSGDLFFNRGSVTIGALFSPSFTANDITFNTFGRITLQGVNATTLTRTGTLTYAAGSLGEITVDNTSGTLGSNYLVDQNGATTLGSGGTGATMRVFLADVASAINITGGVTLGGNSSISVAGGDADSFATISSIISDGGGGYSLAINDDAGGWAQTNTILRLTGANTYTGGTTVSAGVLQVSNGNALGGTAAGTTVADGAALEISGGITTAAESLALNGSGIGNGGALRNTAGNNTYAGNITLATASRINSDAGLLTLDATTGAAIVATDQSLTLGGAGDTTVVDTIDLGTGSLVKDGAGTVILSGNNSYTGTTTVSGGIFLVDGDQSASTGHVTIGDGSSFASVGGSGTIGGVATETLIQNGSTITAGTLSSGTPIVGDLGALTFNGNVTAAAGSIWLVELVAGLGGGADLITVGGLLTLNNATLTINFGGTFVENQVYTIASYGTGLNGTFAGLLEGDFVDPDNFYRINYGSGPSGAITLTAVPEPGTLGFLGLALAGFVTRRIRRRRAAVAAVSQIQE